MDADSAPSSERDTETTRLLQGAHDYILTLPPEERHIATMAAERRVGLGDRPGDADQ